VEKFFEQIDAECSAGCYGDENLVIDSSDGTSVTFQVKHSFGATLSPVEVCYKRNAGEESDDFCWFDSDVVTSDTFLTETFTAKCVNERMGHSDSFGW
jgi:hypothetical protein